MAIQKTYRSQASRRSRIVSPLLGSCQAKLTLTGGAFYILPWRRGDSTNKFILFSGLSSSHLLSLFTFTLLLHLPLPASYHHLRSLLLFRAKTAQSYSNHSTFLNVFPGRNYCQSLSFTFSRQRQHGCNYGASCQPTGHDA